MRSAETASTPRTVEMTGRVVVLLLTGLGAGLVAGALAVFSVLVMPALGDLHPAQSGARRWSR